MDESMDISLRNGLFRTGQRVSQNEPTGLAEANMWDELLLDSSGSSFRSGSTHDDSFDSHYSGIVDQNGISGRNASHSFHCQNVGIDRNCVTRLKSLKCNDAALDHDLNPPLRYVSVPKTRPTEIVSKCEIRNTAGTANDQGQRCKNMLSNFHSSPEKEFGSRANYLSWMSSYSIKPSRGGQYKHGYLDKPEYVQKAHLSPNIGQGSSISPVPNDPDKRPQTGQNVGPTTPPTLHRLSCATNGQVNVQEGALHVTTIEADHSECDQLFSQTPHSANDQENILDNKPVEEFESDHRVSRQRFEQSTCRTNGLVVNDAVEILESGQRVDGQPDFKADPSTCRKNPYENVTSALEESESDHWVSGLQLDQSRYVISEQPNIVCDEVVEEFESDHWVSGHSLTNVTAWMLRNQQHLLPDRQLQDGINCLDQICEDTDESETTGAWSVPESRSVIGYLDTLNGTDDMIDEQLNEADDMPPKLETSRIRSSIRDRLCRLERSVSIRSAPLLGRRSSMLLQRSDSSLRCYLEIWGSDIVQRFSQTSDNDQDRAVLSRRLTTDGQQDNNNPRQSPSELSIIENMVDLLEDIDKSDLVLSDHVGWLYHQQSGQQRWCIVADILLCVFEDQHSTKPSISILLPGADIKLDENDPLERTNFDNNNRPEYGFSVDSNIAGTEHVFFTPCQADCRQWVALLKSAANLDFDVCSNHDATCTSISRKSSPNAGLCEFGSEGAIYSQPCPGNYHLSMMPSISIESPDSAGSSPSFRCRKAELHLDLNKSSSDLSLSSESSSTSRESGASVTDYADFKQKLRRDGKCMNNNLLSPIRALHPADSAYSPQMSSSLDRRLFQGGEMGDQIDHMVLRKYNSNPPMSTSDTSSTNSFSQSPSPMRSAESADNLQLGKSCNRSPPVPSRRHPLSQSMDLTRIVPITSGFIRKASGFKERMFGRKSKSTLPCVTLGSLQETKMSGFLQHKVMLKWQKLFCAISRGCLYAFKTKQESETPVFMTILSNYTITYLLNDKRKKQKVSKPFVFKLSQSNSKSIYLCAAHSLDLARWIQVLQMEASKVRMDSEEPLLDNHNTSYDSLLNKGLFTKTNARYSLGSPCDELNESDFFEAESSVAMDSSSCDLDMTTSSGALSVSGKHEFDCDQKDSGQGLDIIEAWESSSSCSTIYSSTLDSSSQASLDHHPPRHDEALTHVWQQDDHYVVQALRKQAQRDGKVWNKNKPEVRRHPEISRGNSFMVLDEEGTQQLDCEDLTRKTVGQGNSAGSQNIMGGSECLVTRKRHKPVSVRELAVKQLGSLDHSGYMEKRHYDGSWFRYWFCVRRGWLYCYLTPRDLLTVDAIQLTGYQVSAQVDKFPTKSFTLQLSHDHFFSLYFSVESSDEMNIWLHWITQAASYSPSSSPSISHQREMDTGDGPDFPDSIHGSGDGDSFTDSSFDTSSTCSDSFSQARKQLLEHVLSLKHDLEKKQSETRNKHGSAKRSPSDIGEVGRKLQQEQVVHDITRLRQRRLSTQLKVETLQKHMESISLSKKKPLFKFGSKQKIAEPNNNNNGESFMEEQMKELTSTLETIDKNLTQQEQSRKTLCRDPLHDSINRKTSMDVLQSQGHYDLKSMKQEKRRSHSLKVNSTKLPSSFDWLKKLHDTPKTAIHSSPSAPSVGSEICQCNERLEESSTNGKSKTWFWKRRDTKESVHRGKTNGHACSEGHLGVDGADSSSDTSPRPSPRREIDPQVLADIEAFEELTKHVLSKPPESSSNSRQPKFV